MCNNDHFLFFSEQFERLLTKFKVHHPLFFLSMIYIKPSYLFDSLMALTLHRSLHYEQEEEPHLLVYKVKDHDNNSGCFFITFSLKLNSLGGITKYHS